MKLNYVITNYSRLVTRGMWQTETQGGGVRQIRGRTIGSCVLLLGQHQILPTDGNDVRALQEARCVCEIMRVGYF